jgi:uncharacterized protein (DUF302 family)
MLIRYPTRRSAEETAERLRAACAAEGFGVLAVHDLRAKLREKGQTYDRACLVFEVCSPAVARDVLSTAPEVSSLLPCRISVAEGPDGLTLSTVRPRDLMASAGVAGLESAADDVERSLRRIMEASL